MVKPPPTPIRAKPWRRVAEAGRRALMRLRALPGVSMVTPFGATVLLASGVAWVVAATVGWIELLLSATTGLLVVALCGLFVLTRGRPRVEVEPSPRRIVEGTGVATVEARVWNESKVPMLPLELEVTVGSTVETFSLPT
ncbi:MAG: hypothetical protein IRY85_12355, partial [Micromonosporaceae bacterium]|nr:hypothetical protein [Micromonosporaceae bacterium]